MRGWRDFDSRINVVGADIDSRILFSEERISTFLFDQTNHDSWKEFKQSMGNQTFDFIIDDGLHSPIANLVTINEALQIMKPSGIIVIEDIHERSIPVWKLAQSLLPNRFDSQIFRAKSTYIFIVTKNR